MTYGASGNKFFRFYDLRLAESTTRTGRECVLELNRMMANKIAGKEIYKWESAQQLADTYTFPDENIIYSDTDSLYVSLENQRVTNIKDIYNYAIQSQSEVNNNMINFTKDYFFCNDKFTNIIKVALDSIADNAIFIKKKYYVMHLLYDDGKPKEKMKVMGVQIKKTTIPKPISKRLTSFVEDLLKGKAWKEISQEVVDYRVELADAKITEIGLPKGIKKIEEYTKKYNAKVQGLKLPGHVAAAMFYNKCLEVYNDKESPKIISGMKIKTYYLKKNFGYFKSIALPTDLKHPPEWFKINFEPLVDRKGQLDRLIDKPLNSILNAIGKIAPTKKTMLIDELFEY